MFVFDFICFIEDKKEDEENLDERVLYLGVVIIIGFSVFLIMIFVFRYVLSGEVLSDMFILISVYCFFFNLCMKFIFELKKYFYNFKAFMRFYKYCFYCFL